MANKKSFKEKYLFNPNKYILATLLILSVSSFFFIDTASFRSESSPNNEHIFEAEITQIISERDATESDITLISTSKIQELLAKIDIENTTKQITVINEFNSLTPGDKVFVRTNSLGEANEFYEIIAVSRYNGLLLLAIFFALLVFATSGKKGFNAFIGLVFSFSIIFTFIVPQILSGENPITTSLIGAITILFGTFYISYGFNKKSMSALIGIAITLIFVGLLSNILVGTMSFTGNATEEVSFIFFAAKNTISLIGLLIAGIIIAAIGVLDDVAITQASVVSELVSTDSSLSKSQLFKKAMSLGKDHISAVINTLILAYTGASLPLVMLFFLGNYPLGYVVSNELIAEEILRTLIASSGLVLAVPLTTLVAVILFKKPRYN